MKSYVLDASVVAAAFLPEPHAAAARSLLASGARLLAPDLIYSELANVLWKRRRRGELTADEAAALLTDILRLPIRTTSSAGLLDAALHLANRLDRTVYDCLYLSLAIREGVAMVTADRRLVNALAGTPVQQHIAWIGRAIGAAS
jgi:predicted nucleic acid-binding protein